jgi:hypothetical protein
MDGGNLAAGARATFLPDDLTALIEALRARGYRVLGRQTRDGAIVYDTVRGVADLPRGWTDQQEPGRYRRRQLHHGLPWYCTMVEDHTDLTGQEASRTRRWDSCFTGDFFCIHGGSARVERKSRYRQWMTHKLANWIDQFADRR